MPLHIFLRSTDCIIKSRTTQRTLAITLALCFLSVSSLLTAATAKHATHAGHDQTTHQQTWCGWLCAAGQAIEVPFLEPATNFTLLAKSEAFQPSNTSLLLSISPQSRAPPLSL
jgi:hypothetical protein